MPRTWPLLLLFAIALPVQACWEDVASRYGIDPRLLYAIAQHESNLDAGAINRKHLGRTGSVDIGLMQINSRWLPVLQRHGIGEADLLHPCTNLHVGAWILARSFRHNGPTWEAVGAYNAGCSELRPPECRAARARYAVAVYRRLQALDPRFPGR